MEHENVHQKGGDDLVERLRVGAALDDIYDLQLVAQEAANEIERLRLQLQSTGRCESSIEGIGGVWHFCDLLSGHYGAHKAAQIGDVPPMMWTETRRASVEAS